ncbi:MAG: GGDEF domain-containing protein [Bacillota bacterium]|nr:GGDEF domain-containing protein [Bacillota bacterium]
MVIKKNSDCFVLALGELRDKKFESDYFYNEISSALKYIKAGIIFLAALFLLFIIPDYFLIQDSGTFTIILIIRAAFFVLVIFLYIGLGYLKNYTVLVKWFTAYEILASLSFLYICYIYESPNLLIQSFGVIIIISIVFLVPNRWINMILVSVGLSMGFFVHAVYYLREFTFNEITAAAVFISLVIILNSVSSYKINYYKRLDYLNSRKLKKLAATDPLTGIYNRARFNEELEKSTAISKRYNTNLSLVIFDLDDLKTINDNYGHLCGDKVIVSITKIVLDAIRETDIFVRWGGDEFMILLPNTQEQQAVKLTERISMLISENAFHNVGHVSCSFGVVSLEESDDHDSFLHRADKMLYLAKRSGKNTVMSKNFPPNETHSQLLIDL